MRLVVHCTQARDRDVGVQLRGGQRRVAEQLLHDAQVGPALEQVGGGAMPQPMRADVRCAVNSVCTTNQDDATLSTPTAAETTVWLPPADSASNK